MRLKVLTFFGHIRVKCKEIEDRRNSSIIERVTIDAQSLPTKSEAQPGKNGLKFFKQFDEFQVIYTTHRFLIDLKI